MRFPLSMTLLFLAGAAAVTGACGPNVILDGESTSAGTGAATGNGGAGFGGASVSGTTAPGVGGGFSVTSTVAVGTGGGTSGTTTTAAGTWGSFSSTSTAAVGTGGVFSGSSSVAVGTGGVSATSATSTGTGVMGACTDAADGMVLDDDGSLSRSSSCAPCRTSATSAGRRCASSRGPA